MALADVFRALGDPVRLEMVRRLSADRSRTIAEVTDDLGISRQGARKHLQVLVDADLVVLEPKGREVLVRLDPTTLEMARTYIAEMERRWDGRLQALRQLVEGSTDG